MSRPINGIRSRLDLSLMHVDQKEADPEVLRRFRIGADERAAPVGEGCAPDVQILLPFDQPVRPLILAAHLQRREIGAGVGFGIAHAPANRAARDAWEMLALLLFGAGVEDGRPDHRYGPCRHAAD